MSVCIREALIRDYIHNPAHLSMLIANYHTAEAHADMTTFDRYIINSNVGI